MELAFLATARTAELGLADQWPRGPVIAGAAIRLVEIG